MVAIGLCTVLAVLLAGPFSASARETASGVGLLLGGVLGILSCGWRARSSQGLRRRSWALLAGAAAVAVAGNLWVVLTGSDPVESPSLVGETSIGVALLLSIAGLLHFSSMRHRGVELVLMSLDGLVVGGAVLIITSVLVYPQILGSATETPSARSAALVFPVLDVVLVTVALLLVVRSRADGAVLTLVAGGFVMYAVADLEFAVLAAQDRFQFGTPLDLGWIAGYLLVAVAAWHPKAGGGAAQLERSTAGADASGTILLFTVLIVAIVVQIAFGQDEPLSRTQAGLWLMVAVAAGARQTLLAIDNSALRRGLERRVRDQTADLRRLVRQTEVLLSSVGDGIYGVDPDGRVTFINPSGAEALKYQPEDLLGASARDLFQSPEDDGTPSGRSGCYITDAVEKGFVSNGEQDTYVRADGTTIPVEITSSPLLDENRIRGAVVVFRDVTQRREVERMKNEFLSVVSHELRTPLTSIRGSLGLLAGGAVGDLPPTAQRMVTIAVASSERLTRLLNDILDIERIEAGNLPMDLRQRDAADLVREAATEMSDLAASVGVRIEIGGVSGHVFADADRIVQTLVNLLSSAVKFSPEGGVVRVDAQPAGSHVMFRVSDEGRGIPRDKLESIFERFEQVDSSDAREKNGAGLGLPISRGIVERHGGQMWVDSEVGAGTVFRFSLPRVPGEPELSAEEDSKTMLAAKAG